MSETKTKRPETISAVVSPLRFTADLPAMRKFLEVLGLSARVSRDQGWAVMVGASGIVSLHSTLAVPAGGQPGQTDLCFQTPDLDALTFRFAAAGFVADVYDEAWGRACAVRTADGTQVTFDEEPTDRYGYEVEEAQPRHGIVAMPVRFDVPGETMFTTVLALLGYEASGDAWWRLWVGDGGGSVAVGGFPKEPSVVEYSSASVRQSHLPIWPSVSWPRAIPTSRWAPTTAAS